MRGVATAVSTPAAKTVMMDVKGKEKLVVFGYGRERLYTRERAKALARKITYELLRMDIVVTIETGSCAVAVGIAAWMPAVVVFGEVPGHVVVEVYSGR
jgi:hypothetical protein